MSAIKKSKKDKKSKKSKKSHSFERDPYIESLKSKYLEGVDPSLIVPEDEQLSVAWNIQDFHVSIKKPCRPPKVKQILSNVQGYCPPGTLTAILGPSGAGKTSLIRILGQRVDASDYKGDCYINGNVVDPFYFKRVAGFVAQEDVIMGSLKTKEAVMFAAELKLPESIPLEEKEKLADSLISSLGLEHVKDGMVGYYGTSAINSAIKGRLSGGERKRVSICIELVNNPKILYLDEPTSGLDSYAAMSVIENLRKLAYMGRTVVCSIHQPSSDLLKLFDNIIIMSQGQTIYNGPTNAAVQYFGNLGYKCPKFVNPADFFIQTVQAPPEQIESDQEAEDVSFQESNAKKLEKLFEAYRESPYSEHILKSIERDIEKDEKLPKIKKGYTTTSGKQLSILVKRMFLNILREPRLFRVRVGLGIFFAILTGLIWLRLPLDYTNGIERISSSFFLTSSILFTTISGPLTLFAAERAVFYREYNSGMYSGFIFYCAKLISEVPLNIFTPLLNATISYWMIGFHDDPKLWIIFACFLMLLTFVAHGMGMFLAAVFDDPAVGTRLMPIILLPLLLFSGFFLNSSSVPVYFIWLEYISPMKYAYRAVANTIFRGLVIFCKPEDLKNFTIPVPNVLHTFYPNNITSNLCDALIKNYTSVVTYYFKELNKTLSMIPANFTSNFTVPSGNVSTSLYNISCSICPIKTGEDILTQLNLNTDWRWLDAIILAGMFVVLHTIAYLSIQFCKRTK